MSEYAIHTHNLTRDFGSLRAVNSLELAVPDGTIFGFLGPNGAGKTTTIRLLLGLLEPTAGRAEVLGLDTQTQADDVRSRIGVLLEHTGLYEGLSAEHNLEFYGRIWHMAAGERRARIEELLVHLELWERRKEKIGTWSRGMKQKLAIARALLHRPPLVFLDEPTAGLDPIAAAGLREDLATLTFREGLTVFLTTHNLAEAEKLCGMVGVIRQGRLLAVGDPNELRAQRGAPRLEILGSAFSGGLMAALRTRPEVVKVDEQDGRLLIDLREAADAAPLVSLVVSAGARVEEVRRGDASLEDVFLALMEEEEC